MPLTSLSKLFLPVTLAAFGPPAGWGTAVSKPAARKPVVEKVKISKATSVNGTRLQPAEYRLIAKGNKLMVEDFSMHKVVAESPITWKRIDHNVAKTEMDIDHGVLTKVTLGGTHEAVLLHNSNRKASK